MTALDSRIEELIAPAIEALGFSVVRVRLFGQRRPRLQVMIERADERPVDVDDCAEASRSISAVLDVEDPIAGGYTLEVSSPGIDRPLVRLADFERFAGFEAKVEMQDPVNGRRRFTGRLAGVDGDCVRLRIGDEEVALPHVGIQKAKLVLTDELIAASGRQDKATARLSDER